MSEVLERPPRLMPGALPTIRTRSLVLRAHRLTDAEAIAESLGDFAVTRMLARVPTPYDRQDAIDWLSGPASEESGDWHFAITTGDDVHIGAVGIERRKGDWRVGYWLNRYYWGRGFMTEAAAAAIQRFQRRMPETKIYSGAFADNTASLKIQVKLGFAVISANEIFSLSRNAMVPHIETVLMPEQFRMP